MLKLIITILAIWGTIYGPSRATPIEQNRFSETLGQVNTIDDRTAPPPYIVRSRPLYTFNPDGNGRGSVYVQSDNGNFILVKSNEPKR